MSGVVKGWCPSAHRPMMSGDGLLVRVNPRLGWLTVGDVIAICDLADQFGNGVIDLTSRANVQIRGVSEDVHPALLQALIDQKLVDQNATREARRNIVIGSHMTSDGPAEGLAERIEARLDDLPDLPPKAGIAINLGRSLDEDVPGDFRFESSLDGLILRADGVALGRKTSLDNAVDHLLEVMRWFLDTGGSHSGRMVRHVANVTLPKEWQTTKPKPERGKPFPGATLVGAVVGVPFGSLHTDQLRALAHTSGMSRIGVTPWRLLRLEGVQSIDVQGLLMANDPLLKVAACPGAPACAQAEIPTRELARALAEKISCSLHVSGCSKGCARQGAADVTLVGRNGRFDLVKAGRADDTPIKTGLTAPQVMDLF